MSQQTFIESYNVSRSIHVAKIYKVLELKNQALNSSFSKMFIYQYFIPSHSSLIPTQTSMHGLLLDSTKTDSIHSISLLAQTPTFLFRK